MSDSFYSDPGPRKKGNSLLSLCGIFTGSAFFMLILSIGAYHYFYKGIPETVQGPIAHKSLKGALSSLTTPHVLNFDKRNGHLIFTYKMPKTGPVHIKVLDSAGDTVWQDEHLREKGQHGVELPADLFDSSVSYRIVLSCLGKESEFNFVPA